MTNGFAKSQRAAQLAMFQMIALGGWQSHAHRRRSDANIELKSKEVVDPAVVQERINAAEQRRARKKAKRLANRR